ncbi:MAG: D-tyrosyl-tRNA(Tyr) deacylase [Deltaproteobacteria bacterium]|nr:D-tyrosyl-tRNA(Tyr) deacylase [Deltaproteobacteria bacterium]
MRALIQRVKWAKVLVEHTIVGEIKHGLLILLGIKKGDSESETTALAKKISEIRIFADANDLMNLSVFDVGGSCLVVSQFTLYADTKRGRRPFFKEAEMPNVASQLCEQFCETLRARGIYVATGVFGAMMQVESCNDGPVTIWLDTAENKKK